ncbi:MAG: methylated-DNA--[protein]-cysteine S-methyltransferase [Bdellovibrionota bacterium]
MSHLQFQVSVGKLAITWNDQGQLTGIDCCYGNSIVKSALPIPAAAADVADRLRKYFDHGKPIGEIPWDGIDQSAWTPFQARVFRAITDIPHGETRTYGWVAARVGNLGATRAVGQALRCNPLPILIPCHRVVSTNSLGGFMGSVDPDQPQMRLKRLLLGLEEEYLNPVFSFLARATG